MRSVICFSSAMLKIDMPDLQFFFFDMPNHPSRVSTFCIDRRS
jgi:hypothetical protein